MPAAKGRFNECHRKGTIPYLESSLKGYEIYINFPDVRSSEDREKEFLVIISNRHFSMFRWSTVQIYTVISLKYSLFKPVQGMLLI